MTLTEKIRLINTDKSLSKGAKLLTIEIIIASNFRGYCWHSVAALGKAITVSESQVHRHIKEAHESGWIVVKRRRNKTSIYSLGEKFGPQEPRVSAVIPKIKNIKYKENVLVLEKKERPNPPTSETPVDLPMVRKIINQTGDRKSLRYWVKVVRKIPEQEIREALSFLQIAMNEKIIAHPGAYLNALLLKHHPELRRSTVRESSNGDKTPCKVEPEVINPATHEESLAAIARIKTILARKVS